MVDNRGSDGRTPTWTQTDLSLVQRFYPFSDETKSFEINFNVINLFNQKTGLRTFRSLYRQSLPLWQPGDPVSQVLNGYDSQASWRLPRFSPNSFLSLRLHGFGASAFARNAYG